MIRDFSSRFTGFEMTYMIIYIPFIISSLEQNVNKCNFERREKFHTCLQKEGFLVSYLL